MKKISIIFIAISILVSSASAMAGILECSSSTMCQISIFQSSLPNTYHKYSIEIIPPVDGSGNPIPIPAGNEVEFQYEGVSVIVTCNDTWQRLSLNAPDDEIQNQIKCTVGSSRTQVDAYLKVHDQDTYINTYLSPPSYTYSELNNADEASTVCTQDNTLAASAACKWQKQNANNNVLTEQGVPLNAWVVYAGTVVDGLSMGYSVESGNANSYQTSDYVCVVDTNSNGNLEPGEIGRCVEIDETQFCPVDGVECIATYSDVICPLGSALNVDTDKCESVPDIFCAFGYTYNSDVDACVRNVTCSDGGGLNPNSDLCEIVVASDLCPAGYAYDGNLDACTKAVVCMEGGVYNSISDKCEIAYTPTCPSGYTYNSSRDKCEANPLCPSETSYNTTYNVCLKAVSSTTCPSGYIYNSSRERCEKEPDCPVNSAYSASTDRCESILNWTCPENDNTYTSQSICDSSCAQVGICSQASASVTVSGTSGGGVRISKLKGSGNKITGYKYPNSSTGSLTLQGVTVSGSSNSGDNARLTQLVGHGNKIDIYRRYYTSSILSGSLTLQGATVSGSASGDILVKLVGNGNTIKAYFANGSTGTLTFQGDTAYLCSLTNISSPTLADCQANCAQNISCSSTCPSGYTNTGGLCVINANCPSGGTLNAEIDKCQYAPTYNCDSGYTYDSAIGYCKINATCPDSGTLDTSVDKCRLTFTYSCPADCNYDSSTDKCESDPVCDYGYFDGSIDLCRLSASGICPGAYTYNSDQNKCLADPQCLSGALYSTTLNQCSIDAIHSCPTNTAYSSLSRLCEAYPMCETGAYDPSANSCYEGDNTCPYGAQYPCLKYQGKNQCTAQECVQYGGATETGGDPTGANDKQNDGQYSKDGACLGQIYVFNGNDRRCRSGGLSIGFENCCQDEDYLFGLGQCKQEEIQLAKLKGRGLCHEIGEYCSQTLELLFTEICIEHSKSYCCFNSKLSRITHEQGRPQMSTDINNWGSPEGPFCRGFIPEEFQMLDFSRIDLSEWYGDIVPTAQGQVENKMQQSVQRFYDKVN